MYINFNLCRERSESHNAKLQRKLEKMNNEAEYTLQESKSTLEALEQTREINQKVYYVYKFFVYDTSFYYDLYVFIISHMIKLALFIIITYARKDYNAVFIYKLCMPHSYRQHEACMV